MNLGTDIGRSHNYFEIREARYFKRESSKLKDQGGNTGGRVF